MSRVESLTEDGILALFAAKEAEDATRWGTIADTAANTANISSQGLTIASHTSQIATALANAASNASDIAAHGTTLAGHTTSINANAASILAMKPHWVTASSAGTATGGTSSNVGTISLGKGNNIFTGGQSSLTSKMAGIFLWHALFYLPVNAQRAGWINPPDENTNFAISSESSTAGTPDRLTLSGSPTIFTAAGKTAVFQQSSSVTVNTTFNLRGIFFPIYIDAV